MRNGPALERREKLAAAGTDIDRPIERASWLAHDVLLLQGSFGTESTSERIEVSLQLNGRPKTLESRSLAYGTDDETDARGEMLIVFIPSDQQSGSPGTLALRTPEESVDISLAALERISTDLGSLARDCLAPLDADTRNSVLESLATALAGRPEKSGSRVSQNLFTLRQALRERLPPYVQAKRQPRGLSVERLLALDARSFYIQGWTHDSEGEVTRLTAVSPEGSRAELAARAFRYSRPDVGAFFGEEEDPDAKFGFICFFELAAPSLLSNGWIFEMESSEGAELEVGAPSVVKDRATARDVILADPARDRLPIDELMTDHVWPAMTRIQKQVEDAVEIEDIVQFGTPPESPATTVIVPLYGRLDLVELQLAEFANDEEIRNADLVYVLDSPEQADYLVDFVTQLHPIYRVPMRIAVLEENVGFTGANNAGVSLARGGLLLFMNSDVLPDTPGWLGRMASFYDSTPSIGALAPKLLYEDGSIQHAGMYFHQPPGSSFWLDAHYYKGLHRDFPPANVTRPVPGVSGACMMIASDLYEEIGGLRGIYVQGDYEDFDLCLRLAEAGHENWYLPEVELYHLEALSYVGDLRVPANRYNMWLHTHLWRKQIDALMEDHTTGAPA